MLLPVYWYSTYYICICLSSLEQPNPCSEFPRNDSATMRSGTVAKRVAGLARDTVLIALQLLRTYYSTTTEAQHEKKTTRKIVSNTLEKTALRIILFFWCLVAEESNKAIKMGTARYVT